MLMSTHPRFSIRWQVSLLGLMLVAIPFLGWSYWQDVRDTVLSAQGRIQQSEARVIANTLLATQANIRELLAGDEDSEVQKYALSAPSVKKAIRLDGRFDDWPIMPGSTSTNGSGDPFKAHYVLWQANPQGYNETAMALRLAQSAEHLFVAIRVRDHQRVYRDAAHLRLDYSDHIQFTYVDAQARIQRVIIPAEKEGPLASYFTDAQWQYGRDISRPGSETLIPSHKTGLQGFWRKTDEGYAIEFRIPLAELDTRPSKVHFKLIDVDDHPERGPKAIIATLPENLADQLNPVSIHARELQRIIDHLKNTYSRLWIMDRLGWEWAYAERDIQEGDAVARAGFLPAMPVDRSCIAKALAGQPEPVHYLSDRDGELERLLVCYPIREDGETLGVVVIEESAAHVLAGEEKRMRDIAIKIGAAISLLFLALFIYALILVRRISKLSSATARSIDHHGRIESNRLQNSRHFPDEIGDLSHSISTLLDKQQTYIRFLERIPQTLRHEISNPLNKLRTSLENLLDEQPALEDNRYLKKMDKGINQISAITQQLTEAANLENAIQEEPLSRLDLIEFIDGYFATLGPPVTCEPWDSAPAFILGDASRLEQLFDKLLDNAVSFCPEHGKVIIRIERNPKTLSILIENDGPLLPLAHSDEYFFPMVSTRSSGNSIHLGLGLHIAKLICEHHQAKLEGKNRSDESGVVFSVTFRLIDAH